MARTKTTITVGDYCRSKAHGSGLWGPWFQVTRKVGNVCYYRDPKVPTYEKSFATTELPWMVEHGYVQVRKRKQEEVTP